MASTKLPHANTMDLSQIMKELECPKCLKTCSSPIMQCTMGHNLCEKCGKKSKECPTCGAKISHVRNKFAEILSQVAQPCVNQNKGCPVQIMVKDMDNHLKVCTFALTKCLLSKRSPDNHLCFLPCDWKGKSNELVAHVVKLHPNCLSVENTAEVTYKLRNKHVFLISAYGQLFWSLLSYDFNNCDMRGAVFSAEEIKPMSAFEFQFQFESADRFLKVIKKGNVCNQGSSDENYNSTIFQGRRMVDQLTSDKKLKFKIKIMKKRI